MPLAERLGSGRLRNESHDHPAAARYNPINSTGMGFNKRRMEDERRQAAEQEAAARRATDAQVVEDAERLIGAWNERQAKRMPMLFSPTIGASITSGACLCRGWTIWADIGPVHFHICLL